jgi:hypothetical protein
MVTGTALAESAFAAALGGDSLQSYVFMALRHVVDQVVADMPERLVPRVRRRPEGVGVRLSGGHMHLAPARRGITVRIEDGSGAVVLAVENFQGRRYGRIAGIHAPATRAGDLLRSAIGNWPDLPAD